jgi:hypothetical protein
MSQSQTARIARDGGGYLVAHLKEARSPEGMGITNLGRRLRPKPRGPGKLQYAPVRPRSGCLPHAEDGRCER